MFRPFNFGRLAIAVLVASAPATAAQARVGPEIAYSTATEVYLVSLDGSGKVKLHRSRSNDFISSIALKPGGGTVAWVENWTLKFLDYNASGQPIGTVRTIRPVCYRLADVHFHPDGQSVLYQELCPEGRVVKSVAVPTTAVPNPSPATLFTNAELQDLGPWEPGGNSFLYTALTATHMELRRHYTDGRADPMAIRSATPSEQLRYPDVSSDGTTILIAHSPFMAACCPGPGYVSEIDAQTGSTLKPNFITGNKARYAPDGERAIFIVASSYNARYLRYLDSDGQVKQIGGKGVYWSVDWGE